MACCALLGAILTVFFGLWRWLKGERETVTPFAPPARRAAPGEALPLPVAGPVAAGASARRPLLVGSALLALLLAGSPWLLPAVASAIDTTATPATAAASSCALPLSWESYFDDAR